MQVYCKSYALLLLFCTLKIPLSGTKSLNSHGFVIFSRPESEEPTKNRRSEVFKHAVVILLAEVLIEYRC